MQSLGCTGDKFRYLAGLSLGYYFVEWYNVDTAVQWYNLMVISFNEKKENVNSK